MHEYSFSSTPDWYLLQSRDKKQHRTSADPNDLPDFDAEPDEDSANEPVVQKSLATAPAGPKRYAYQGNCGYSFKTPYHRSYKMP